MKIVGVIPARYKSTRFPGKPLVPIHGKPMILHVAARVSEAIGIERTFIATDDEKIKDTVENAGYKVVMTSESCLTGTDRLWDFAQQIPSDIYLNIQGDEPMVDPEDIKKVLLTKKDFPEYIINGMTALTPEEDPSNINIPKVLVNAQNELIYMSRLPIPGVKSSNSTLPVYMKQVCIYAFSHHHLKAFGSRKVKSKFEAFEDIEILRFFDLNIPVKMVEFSKSTLAVDTPDDVKLVEKAML